MTHSADGAPYQSEILLGSKILTWIGIINQLAEARSTRVLAALKLPYPQFVLLNHFSHRPEVAQTVTGVAAAMQQPQPGVTKTIQKLVARKYLRAAPAPNDRRSKLLTITPKGLEMYGRAIATLVPVFRDLFEPWSEREMSDLIGQLDRLKEWLDTKGRE